MAGRPPARRYAEFEVLVQAPPQRVRAQLADPLSLPRLHPLIDQVQVTSRTREGDVEVVDFAIHEHVPLLFGLLRVPNRYRGQLRLDPADPWTLLLRGWSWPRVRIELRYTLQGDAAGPTLVREQLWYAAPAPLQPLLTRIIEPAHQTTLRRLAEVLGPTP